MAFFKTLLIASVAAFAYAAPQGGASDGNTKVGIDSQSNEAKCGNGQKLACCNSGEDLIGLNCLSIPIRESLHLPPTMQSPLTIPLTVAVPIQKACGSNVAACCQTGDAEGNLINLELNCLALPL